MSLCSSLFVILQFSIVIQQLWIKFVKIVNDKGEQETKIWSSTLFSFCVPNKPPFYNKSLYDLWIVLSYFEELSGNSICLETVG